MYIMASFCATASQNNVARSMRHSKSPPKSTKMKSKTGRRETRIFDSIRVGGLTLLDSRP